jgi:hypothetical protein
LAASLRVAPRAVEPELFEAAVVFDVVLDFDEA